MVEVLALFGYRLSIRLKLFKRVHRVLHLGDPMLEKPLIQQLFYLTLFLLHLSDVILDLRLLKSLFEDVSSVPILIVLNSLILFFQVFDTHLFEYIVAESLPGEGIHSLFFSTSLETSDINKSLVEISSHELDHFDDNENNQNESKGTEFKDRMATLETLTSRKERNCKGLNTVWEVTCLEDFSLVENKGA